MQASNMTGKVAIVTGAGGGIGAATALTLARAGADVAIVDVKADGLTKTGDAIAAMGRQFMVHTVDLSNADACHGLVAATVERFGRLDALCNVAGILKMSHSHEMTVADWNLVFAVNVSAPFFLAQSAMPHLIESSGAIVNVSSLAAHIATAYQAAYCASKAALSHMTKAMAMEYMHTGVRINAISPGGLATPISASFVPPDGADLALLARLKPSRGLVEVADMANMIAFLASPAASAFHGADIHMDKGITAG